jgi:predicted metal-dependent phosphoesterase TrpH
LTVRRGRWGGRSPSAIESGHKPAPTDASEDGRAPSGPLAWLTKKRPGIPVDGIVLTEHRQWDPHKEYRALEDAYGLRILRGAEVETDYGHFLLYGVNDDIAGYFDFTNVRLDAQELVTEVARRGGVALPCHPGRPTIGLCEHYETKPPLEGVVAVEALNGGSRKGENERVRELIERYGYHSFGGSDSHLVSFVGICATEFDRDVRDIEDLVVAMRAGGYKPLDFRDRLRK